ncbi:MAG: SHOCT domain-containing protein [Bacteroidia bacterium]
MNYNDFSFWGMHLIWWLVWVILIFWIFATPYNIPGQRTKKDTPLDILKKRFASGEITKEQYIEHKSILKK